MPQELSAPLSQPGVSKLEGIIQDLGMDLAERFRHCIERRDDKLARNVLTEASSSCREVQENLYLSFGLNPLHIYTIVESIL